ncbi:MAG: ABC transporter permease [Betaproteobacteria bacterium]|nr:ABC transporter permease [Betaproteobacteria bacterium]
MTPLSLSGAAWIVFAKEIVDALRDRRTLLLTLFGSALSGPLVLLLLFKLISTEIDRADQLRLPVVGAERAPALIAYLERERVRIEPPPAEFQAKIRAGEIEVVLEIDAAFESDVAAGRAARVRLYYDESRQRTGTTTRAVRGLLRGFAALWGDQRLALRGIAADVGQPLAVETINLATPQQSGSQTLAILAYYAVFATLLGGVASAADSTAGERERGTLAVLLAAPVQAGALILGKWLAVAALACAVLALTLTGFYLTLQFGPVPRVGIPFVFGAREYGGFLLMLLPLACCFAAVLICLGALGRTFKEAQTNSQILITVAALLPVVQMFQFGKEPEWLKWVPINGHFLLLTRILRGDAIAAMDWVAGAALPAAITAVALLLAARNLKRRP